MVESIRDEGERLEDRGGPAERAGDASSGGQAEASGAEERLIGANAWAADGEQANADPVLTETAADLYARQGLHERAASVYSRLLEERPDDTNLQEKLRRAREAAARRTGHEAVPSLADEVEGLWDRAGSGAVAAESGAESGDDGELEEVEAAWTGGAGALAAERTPYAWEEEPSTGTAEDAESREAVAGRSVGEYLRKLLSWRPSALSSAPAEPEPGERDSGGASAMWPVTSPDVGLEIVERLTMRASGAESSGGGELSELFVGSGDAGAGPAPDAAEAGATRREREEEAESGRESPWDRAASRGRGVGAVERLVSETPSRAEQAREAADRASTEEEDDDELEMFRAWLQSLKR